MIRQTFTQTDEKLLYIANRYVMSQLFQRKWPSDNGPVEWRTFHEAAKLQFATYPRRKPKKDKK